MVESFKCKETKRIFEGRLSPRLPDEIQLPSKRKLNLIHFAMTLEDLRVPPGNRLEKLKGDRIGQYSIRINNQWRICFTFNGHAFQDVEITDHHKL